MVVVVFNCCSRGSGGGGVVGSLHFSLSLTFHYHALPSPHSLSTSLTFHCPHPSFLFCFLSLFSSLPPSFPLQHHFIFLFLFIFYLFSSMLRHHKSLFQHSTSSPFSHHLCLLHLQHASNPSIPVFLFCTLILPSLTSLSHHPFLPFRGNAA